MIHVTKNDALHFEWIDNTGKVHGIDKKDGTVIFSEEHVYIMNSERTSVVVLDEHAHEIGSLNNNDEVYLRYLLSHPVYGPCIAISSKNAGKWVDTYVSFRDGHFEKRSAAR